MRGIGMSGIGAKSPRTKSLELNRPGWTPTARRAKLVGEFVPGLMRPAFEKFGFSASTLLTDWEAIAGREMAAFTAPERLKWPRQAGDPDSVEQSRGATLILRVAGARALEVEQTRGRLIERINAAFGYRAVSEIRIIQAPLPKRVDSRPAKLLSTPADEPSLSALPDGPLKQAFARMASGMKLRQQEREAATG
jgi:hypothetical protein